MSGEHQRGNVKSDQELIAEYQALLPPYAQAMGIFICRIEHDVPILQMDFGPEREGWPGLFHGGTLAGVLEMAGFAAVLAALRRDGRSLNLKPFNHSTNFLREARVGSVYAYGRVTRLGGRSAHVQVEAWQSNRETPVAEAVMNVLLKSEVESSLPPA